LVAIFYKNEIYHKKVPVFLSIIGISKERKQIIAAKLGALWNLPTAFTRKYLMSKLDIREDKSIQAENKCCISPKREMQRIKWYFNSN